MEGKIVSLLFVVILSTIYFYSSAVDATPPSDLKIYEVSPFPYPKTDMEYICIYNPLNLEVELSNYSITDFEGRLYLVGKIKPQEKIYIAENRSSFERFMGFSPQYTFSSLKMVGEFSLRNFGDEVALIKRDKLVDLVVYGDSNYHGNGWSGKGVSLTQGHILRRKSLEDTNTAMDWSNYHVIGQSDLQRKKFKVKMEIFPYPDEWREVLRFVKGARKEIEIEAYTMWSNKFANLLISKIREGVRVKILLEGHPVGGIPQEEKYLVHKIWEKGGEIRFMINDPPNGSFDRYVYLHSKFIIRDSSHVLISTENFGESSLRECGNRGYGVIIQDRDFACYMQNMFLNDWKNLQDIREYRGEFSDVEYHPHNIFELRSKVFRSINLTAEILPVIAPDFSIEAFYEFINSQNNLEVEAPYIGEEIWERIENKTSMVLVGDRNLAEHGNFKLFDGDAHHILSLHAKLIVGDSAVLVGSMNFNLFSMKNNREVSLIIESRTLVNYFHRILKYDMENEEPHVVMLITKFSDGIILNFSRSIGPILKCRVYVDGKLVYEGENLTIFLHLSGRHSIRGEVVDNMGRVDSVETNIDLRKEKKMLFDYRIFLLLILLALFFYKVWKDHG